MNTHANAVANANANANIMLDPHYTHIVKSLGISQMINEWLDVNNNWVDCADPIHNLAYGANDLNTPEKRQQVYENYINNLVPGMRRTGSIGMRLHHNVLLAQVEYHIRKMRAAQVIQKAWCNCWYNPAYTVCKSRLVADCEEFNDMLEKHIQYFTQFMTTPPQITVS